MAMKKRVLFLIFGLCLSIASFAQVQVSGSVSDSQGEPIPGVTVLEKGTQNGVITDIDGNYNLSVAGQESVLVFSFVGMQTQEVTVGGQTTIDVVLSETFTDLDEVVVVGYGVQKKKLTTGANLNVSSDDLQAQNTSEPLEAIQSMSPGVNITQSSGMPGSGYKVNIRGLGTIGNSQPLYVIDGVAGGDINNLNPADIESIDVLKDAASAAIYGARAANGVILVTTKQGRQGNIEVTYDGYYGVQDIENIAEPLNAQQWMDIYNKEAGLVGGNVLDWAAVVPELYQRVQNGWEGTDWMQETYNKNAPVQNHAINISGGSEQSIFSMGFSYSSQEGVLGKPVEPKHDKYTFRLNSDHVIYENNGLEIIKVGQTLNYSHRKRSGVAIGGMYYNDIRNMLQGNPLVPVYDEEGNYTDRDFMLESGLEKEVNSRIYNPIALMDVNRGMNETKNYNINGSAYFQVQPIQGLTFKSNLGYRYGGNSYRSYQPEYSLASDVSMSPGRITQSSGNGHHWTFENTLNYSFDLGLNSFDVLVGQSVEKWGIGEGMNTTNANPTFIGYDYAYIDNTDGHTPGVSTMEGSPWDKGSLSSLFGRLTYDFDEKYLLTLVMRADGSSNFAEGNRWGYFPSVSAGWVVSEESFMENSDVFDFLKLRASWGQNGNSDIDRFQYLSLIGFDTENNYSFGNNRSQQQLGGYPAILPNPDVTWETSEQLDIGLDAYFLNSRLQVAFDYYNKETKDWLVQAPLPDIFGPEAPFVNAGDVENKGFELALRWNDSLGDLDYGLQFNVSKNENEVTKLGNATGFIQSEDGIIAEQTGPVWRVQTGYPVGYFYGYKTEGVFQNQQQIDDWSFGFLQENPEPGDLIFSDTNLDGDVTEEDKTMIGNPHPDVRIGFGINLAYKGFDFSVSGKGAFGHQIMKSYRSFVDNYWHNYTTDIIGKYWDGEGTSNSYPSLKLGTSRNSISDIYVEDGDFIKIQNVTLGYDFKELFPEMPFGQARLYVAGRNLLTITDYSGMDPEVGFGDEQPYVSGIDLGFYPAPRTYLVGINLKF
ncbi:TonB-linked SusC/RagA family outer membrane protein [Marinilabilia salmonicolor]|jgi:TonB-linked SusC/RagA family outer membrane protein|nr:TonB-linked SusC/RagA family outer membrane protein [Marinilabilia salmonicolor]